MRLPAAFYPLTILIDWPAARHQFQCAKSLHPNSGLASLFTDKHRVTNLQVRLFAARLGDSAAIITGLSRYAA